MIDETRDKGMAFVCSVTDRNKKNPYLFRTYRGTTNHAHNVEIWEAARATTAAPTFFRPMQLKIEAEWDDYMDGALAVNNPAKLVLKEAEAQFGTGRKLGFLLSLGTGLKADDKAVNVDVDAERVIQRAVQEVKPRKSGSGAFLSRGTFDILKLAKQGVTDTEPTHRELNERFSGTPNAYFRFNLDQGAADIKLNQYKKMVLLRAATEEYLRKPEVSADIDQVASLLHNQNGARMPLISAVRARSDESDKHAVGREIHNRTDVMSDQFTGREEILSKMEKHFFESLPGASTPRRMLRIWGMGGVGKTQIAVRFRDLHKARFEHIFWINAATQDSVYESFRQVTETLLGGEHSRPEMKAVHRWMCKNRSWLLIFDNNDSIDVSKWVPPGDTGNILFTSRRRDIQPRLNDDQTLAVDIMSSEEAVKLILKSAQKDKTSLTEPEEWYAKEIAKELGNLPLALDQAGSYINLMDCPFSTYLFEFKERRKEFMEDPSMARGAFEHNPAVYGTFELSYDALITRSKEDDRKGRAALNALRVLNIFCFYHNENLTDEIISRAATNKHVDKDVLGDMESLAPLPLINLKRDKSWDPSNFAEGISLLKSYSLVKKAAINDEWHSMHILVHSWARDRMREDVFNFQHYAARSIIFDCFHRNFNFDDERFLIRLLPHLIALMDRDEIEGDWCKKTMQDTKYARLLREVGMWREALHVLKMIVQERQDNLEASDWLLIDAIWDLAKMNKTCCNFKEAEMLFEKCTNMVIKCSNRKWATKVVMAMGIDYAEVFIQTGFLGTAEAMLTYIVEQIKPMGEDHPEFRRGVAGLAMTMQLAGKYAEAEGLESRMFKLCIDNPRVGPGHRLTMGAISNLATLRSAKGEHEKADDMWRHVLEVDEEFRGKEHPITLASKRNVAIGSMRLNRLDNAEKILREVLEASDRVLWRTHVDTLATIECLAEVLYQKGEVDEALELQEECYEGRLEVLGAEHRHTVKATDNLRKMVEGRPLGAEELVQVQWQGEVVTETGDSNLVQQGMNDRYLY
ncbi:protein kinase subdomain-containing protein [Colletotrichum sp. SAR11_57]|nr:protein kinase subdomain-containing protein [Colletotrichum sp. SAR11_57]